MGIRLPTVALVVLTALFVAAPNGESIALAQWPWSGWFSDPSPVGTAEWWKKNQKRATFEPGKGYSVPGVDGYFDADGRPISGPVAMERVVKAAEDQGPDVGIAPGLDPRVQIDRMKSAVGMGPDQQAARQAYNRGVELFNEERYSSAAKQFKEAANRGVRSPIEQDAMFMLAECYFFNDQYIKARDAYDALVKKFPNSRYLDTVIENEWKIAQYWEKYEDHRPDWLMTPNAYDKTRPWFDTIGHAIKTYDNIRLNDPTGPRAADAIMATANIYFRRSRYDDADYHYTLLRREYPRSEHQFEAHLLGLQSKLRKYQGPDYDGQPLEEAKVLVRQLRQQFAGRLSPEERDRLTTVESQLNYQIAQRDYRMATYFDDIKHYRSAKMYYAQVIKQHPESELAQEARERFAQIAEEPDTPPKRLAWIVDRFPQSHERSRVSRVPEIQQGTTRMAEAPGGASTDATR